MKFSIGYNYDIKLLGLLDIYKDHIDAFYFPLPQKYLGSGRNIPQPRNYVNQVPKIIERCNSLNITSQLLLNATCEGEFGLSRNFFKRLVSYIKKLRGIGLGSIVITNPIYINRLKEEISDIRIESSVNCYIKTIEQALYLKDLGVDVLTIDRDINRNIPLIKEIKNRTNLKIRLMLNEGCLRNCPFRIMHYNYLSHRNSIPKRPIDGTFPDHHCIEIYLRNTAKVFSIPFIPPDALRHYESFVDYYKLSTRVFPTKRIELCLKAYINQQFNGNLLEILDSPGLSYFEYIDYNALSKSHFFEKMKSCIDNCNRCAYCNTLLKEATVVNRDFLKKKNKKDERKAIRIYKNVLQASPNKDDSFIYEKLSKAYFNLREYKEALRLADKVIKLAPTKITGYLLLGSYFEQIKRNNKALQVYKKALTTFPFDGAVYLCLARVYLQLKKYKETIKNINRAKAINYKESGMHFLLGLCYERTGKYKKAIEEFKKERKTNPENAQIALSLARCYRNIGRTELVNKEIDRCIPEIKSYKVEPS